MSRGERVNCVSNSGSKTAFCHFEKSPTKAFVEDHHIANAIYCFFGNSS